MPFVFFQSYSGIAHFVYVCYTYKFVVDVYILMNNCCSFILLNRVLDQIIFAMCFSYGSQDVVIAKPVPLWLEVALVRISWRITVGCENQPRSFAHFAVWVSISTSKNIEGGRFFPTTNPYCWTHYCSPEPHFDSSSRFVTNDWRCGGESSCNSLFDFVASRFGRKVGSVVSGQCWL